VLENGKMAGIVNSSNITKYVLRACLLVPLDTPTAFAFYSVVFINNAFLLPETIFTAVVCKYLIFKLCECNGGRTVIFLVQER
jgi:hypothetical protein